MDIPFIEEEKDYQKINKLSKYKICCINKDLCITLIPILCILLIISILTFINIYAIYIEDGSLSIT